MISKVNPDWNMIIEQAAKRGSSKALALTWVDFTIISGRRNMDEQRRLVRQGASRILHSRHLSGHALDLVPIDPVTGKG